MLQAPIHPVNCRYGAPMGRGQSDSHGGADIAGKLSLQRVRINAGGYDSGGAYWGLGAPLYWYGDNEGIVSRYLRAITRAQAKRFILIEYPNASFYR